MKDTYFVQFYNYRKGFLTCLALCNGLSDTWNICKSKGDLVWLKTQDYIEENELTSFQFIEPPAKKGILYVSCLYLSHLYQSFLWAETYPNLTIVCGGPIISLVRYNTILPKNLILTELSLEEYFGIKNFSDKWTLEFPNEIEENSEVFFTYTLDTFCYSSRCIFCNFSERKRQRLQIDYDICSKVKFNKKSIMLYTPSIKPAFVNNLQNFKQDKNTNYVIFLRPDKNINKQLKKLYSNSNKINLTVNIGIDFLGNRMLKYIDKNHTVEESIETMEILEQNNVNFLVTTILRWPVLTDKDIDDVEKYMQNPVIKRQKWVVNDLTAAVKSKLEFDPLYHGEEYRLGPFLVGYIPNLSIEQQEKNEKVRTLLHNNIPSLSDRMNKHKKKLFYS